MVDIVKPSWEILHFSHSPDEILKFLELCARTCYKSQDKITEDSARKIINLIMTNKHESVIEHVSATVRFVSNRGFTHEIVRHRLASYSQESTRFVNYGKKDGGIAVIDPRPVYGWETESELYQEWLCAMEDAEHRYLQLLAMGAKPQQARGVLPIDVKTEIVMTANIREWRHVFKMRCPREAHPMMQYLMRPLLLEFSKRVPLIYDDLVEAFG